MPDYVRTEPTALDGVATLRLDRPDLNQINQQVGEELLEELTRIENDPGIRGLVVWGGPNIFSLGAEVATWVGERNPTKLADPLNEAIFKLENLPMVTVAAVNGFAFGGGCELSMGTDFRVCGTSAQFGQPEVLLGIIAGAGGTQRLTRLVGVTKSKELNYSGRFIDATEAKEIGLVSAVVPDQQVLDHAVETVGAYVNGPAAIVHAKRAIMGGLEVPLREAMAIEKEEFVASFQTEDAAIGIGSFLADGLGAAEFTGS